MPELTRPQRRKIACRAHRGQTLFIALAIMFVLLIIGGIFVTQVARNLVTAGRARETQNAQSYAEMGNRPKLESVLKKLHGMEAPLLQQYRADTNNAPLAFQLVSVYMVSQQTNEAMHLLDDLIGRTNADASTLLSAAQAYAQLLATPKLEVTLQKLAEVVPDSPEAWYDLATVQATMGKAPEALKSLRKSLSLNKQRMAGQAGAKDLRPVAATETRFALLRQSPEFQQLVRTN